MGLTGLVGGGMVPFALGVASTGDNNSSNPPIGVGSEATDSSGGRYVMMRVGSTTQIVGSWVILNSSIGTGWTVLTSTGASLSSGSALGVAMSTANSTNQYAWYQTYGPGVALFASSATAAGARAWQSTTAAGQASASSGGTGFQGVQTTSSNASSLVNVWLSYPHMIALTGS